MSTTIASTRKWLTWRVCLKAESETVVAVKTNGSAAEQSLHQYLSTARGRNVALWQKTKIMPLWEGVLASFCAGVGVSILNRFALSQITTPCERRQAETTSSDDSSDDSGETAAASLASIAHAEGVHFHGGAE